MKKDVKFEQWQSPFYPTDDETDFKPTPEPSPAYSLSDEDEEEMLNDEQEAKMARKPIPFINSTIGIIPLNEHTDITQQCALWVGHCNFDVSKPVLLAIEKIAGVEILDVFTRYRFRVGCGKMFNPSKVLREIKKVAIKASGP